MEPKLVEEIRRLVLELVGHRYAEIVGDGRGGRLSEVEIRTAIAEYGRTLIPLPDEAWAKVDVYERIGHGVVLGVDVPLWTAEEGRSDLTLSLEAVKDADGFHIEIEDLHVL